MCPHPTKAAQADRLPCLVICLQQCSDTPDIPKSPSALRALIEQTLPVTQLRHAALRQLTARLDIAPDRLQRSLREWSEPTRERIHTQVVIDDVTAVAWQVFTGRDDDPPHAQKDPGRYYRALVALLGHLPAMRIAARGSQFDPHAIARVVQLMEEVPGWRWTLEVNPDLLTWIETPPNSHTKDVLRLSLNTTTGHDDTLSAECEQPPGRPTVDTPEIVPTSTASERGAGFDAQTHSAQECLAAAKGVLETLPAVATEREPQMDATAMRARSLAELALYKLLESHEETRQLFSLNQRMPFHFGPRAAELDLYSPLLRMCIEVDGPHHFVSADGYRRDRRKDALLQEHGIWVLRILAEDVVQRTDEVVNFVLKGVRIRRAKGC